MSGLGVVEHTMARSSQQWRVRLGDVYWRRFTHPRAEDDPLRLLGSIERGAQIGALAVDPEGLYFQVNGDHLAALSTSQVRAAVRRAQGGGSNDPEPRPKANPQQSAPVVIVKRKRVLAI
ncbi:hypothetical protein [Caldimonas brevitalea]|uniref:Uncharacterized protein n=1 Tax=Caldimonas brevitalea TaxID=413882 RepID=A0A0G3BYS0_9BURK|nr:hypothetical protein [Caldimonas brevitalea]AKJ31675.1 hypothetical protein AAW51_4984 [Caldimonas brevitalea]